VPKISFLGPNPSPIGSHWFLNEGTGKVGGGGDEESEREKERRPERVTSRGGVESRLWLNYEAFSFSRGEGTPAVK